MEYVIIALIIYAAFHLGHAHAKYWHYRRYPWYKRVWVSVPGPFGTRIGKRI